jgi:hypothetical protein
MPSPSFASPTAAGFASPSWFMGALLPVCCVEILIVVVHPRVMFDIAEANLYVTAFHRRFGRTVVLMSQAETTFLPTYYGPAGIVKVLSALPFDIIPWQRLLYRTTKSPPFQLPIPPERTPEEPDASVDDLSDSSIEDLSMTRIRDPHADDLRAAAERMACSTRR